MEVIRCHLCNSLLPEEGAPCPNCAASLERLAAALSDRYAIDRPVGSGGMATVYLAEDLKHHRKVAIKVLKPELAAAMGSERFLKEIEVTASLQHPHILPLFDSGEEESLLYYVMPYVQGETLRERLVRDGQLPLDEALSITREIADGLSHAHGFGVIHRDIKPENVLLTGNHAVLADFGIARAVTAAGGEQLTETGLAIGTPAYMSPEQASGSGKVDARSDLYSLACVLYEMLGGEPPYTGPTPQAILAKKAVEPVPDVRVIRDTVSEKLGHTIARALAKTPADRFATVARFAHALSEPHEVPLTPLKGDGKLFARWRSRLLVAIVTMVIAGGFWLSRGSFATDGVESLVVLPFEDLSGGSAEPYMLAGMYGSLIGQLSRISSLRVISRRSATKYANSGSSLSEIGRALNVDRVVEVSVLQADENVRLQVQLIQIEPEESNLWSDDYESGTGDLPALYGEVAQDIADEIAVDVTPEERASLSNARPVDTDTYRAYLRGMFFLNTNTPEGIERGLQYLNDAVAADPADPLAYAGLALAYSLIGHMPAPPPDAFVRASAAANRALELDPTNAEAHAALAEIKLYFDWDWVGAGHAFEQAVRLNSSLAQTHGHYGWYLLLMGRPDEGVAEMRRAIEVDPLAAVYPAWLGWMLLWSGRWDEAIAEEQRSLELTPGFPVASYLLGVAYAQKGMFDEAIAASEAAGAGNRHWRWGLGIVYALAGRPDEARAVAAEIEAQQTVWDTWGLAEIYGALGDKEKTMVWLDAAYQQHHSYFPWINHDPFFELLHGDPRFEDYVQRLALP